MKIKANSIVDGYRVLLVCEEKLIGTALAYKETGDEIDWATFDYFIHNETTSFWHKGMTHEEAKMDFFERCPLFLSKYDVYENVKNEMLKEEAQNKIAYCIYGTDDIDYYQSIELQKRFNVDEVIKIYKETNDWVLAIYTYVENNKVK